MPKEREREGAGASFREHSPSFACPSPEETFSPVGIASGSPLLPEPEVPEDEVPPCALPPPLPPSPPNVSEPPAEPLPVEELLLDELELLLDEPETPHSSEHWFEMHW